MKTVLSWAAKNNMVLTCGGVFVLSVLFVPFFSTTGNLYNLLLNTCLFGIVAIGSAFTLLTGAVDFSVGYQVALYSILVCIFTEAFGFWGGVAITVLIGCVLGVINALAINLLRVNPMVVTLGAMMIVRGIASILSGKLLISCSNATLSGLYSLKIGGILPLPVMLFVLIFVCAYFFLRNTRTGIGFYIVGGNANAGHIAGINIGRIRVTAFVLSGVLTAIGGILFASRLNTGAVSIGENMTMTILSSCVIGGISIVGGKGNLIHLIFGVLLIQIINNLMALFVMPASSQLLFTGTILILVLIVDRASRAKNRRRGISI